MINLELIKDLAQKLPGAEMSTSYGTPSVKARKKLILRLHQKEDAIVMMVDTVAEQQALIESDPMTFYITDHPSNHRSRAFLCFDGKSLAANCKKAGHRHLRRQQSCLNVTSLKYCTL